jgi:hypothetical protein
MRQLVGQLCVHCRERIPCLVDGDFCAACGCPVHDRCRATASVSPAPDACKTCAASAADVAVHAPQAKEDRREQLRRERTVNHLSDDFGHEGSSMGELAAFRRVGIGGAWCIGSIVFIMSQADNPKVGLTLMIGGGFFLLGAVYLYFGLRQLLGF